MSLFGDIVKDILKESVDVSTVNDAINHHYEAIIKYKTDGEDEHTDQRLIQPVAYGTTKSGNPVVRAFQPYGDSTTKGTAWKFFRLDRIVDWKTLKLHIFSQPPGTSKEVILGKFNPNGDETMEDVFNIASFGKGKKEKTVLGPVTKNDVSQNKGNTVPTPQENPATGQKPTGPVTKDDVKAANGEKPDNERLRNKLSDEDYVSQALNDYEYGPDNNKETEEEI